MEHLVGDSPMQPTKPKEECPKEFQIPHDHVMVVKMEGMASFVDLLNDQLMDAIMNNKSKEEIDAINAKIDEVMKAMARYRSIRFNVELLKHVRFPCFECRELAGRLEAATE